MPEDHRAGPIDDHQIAADAATAAGDLLMALRADLVAQGAPRWAIEQEGDRQAHELITGTLARLVPDDAVLSEEGADDLSRLSASRAWIVDPLDGTREYGEHPRSDFAVHVALVVNHQPVAGAVALPALGRTFATRPAPTLPAPVAGGPRLVVSRSRPAAICYEIADRLDGALFPLGSAGAKAMAVVNGEADVYAHAGGQYEWDSCAPVAVAMAAGLHVSRIDGSPLYYNRPDPWLPDFLICRPEYAEAIIEIVQARIGTAIGDQEAELWR